MGEGLRVGSGDDRAGRTPAVRLAPFRKPREPADDDRRGWRSTSRYEPARRPDPNPSVETLLHAFLPARFTDTSRRWTRSSPQATSRGRATLCMIFGRGLGPIPYVMLGFALAGSAAPRSSSGSPPRASWAWRCSRSCPASMRGASAKESYERIDRRGDARRAVRGRAQPHRELARRPLASTRLARSERLGCAGPRRSRPARPRARAPSCARARCPRSCSFCAARRGGTRREGCATPDHVPAPAGGALLSPPYDGRTAALGEASRLPGLAMAVLDYDAYFEAKVRRQGRPEEEA